MLPGDFTTNFMTPIANWLSTNQTKRPSYVILFPDLPSRVNTVTNYGNYGGSNAASVQWQIRNYCSSNWIPFVTSINMNGTNGATDCISYIQKLQSMASNNPPYQLILSASAASYGNVNWYFDDTEIDYSYTPGFSASNAVVQLGVSPTNVDYLKVATDTGLSCHITNGTNLAGYLCWGSHSTLGANYATNNSLTWKGKSSWYLMMTIESFNGMRDA